MQEIIRYTKHAVNIMANVTTSNISSPSNAIYELLHIRKVEIRTASERISFHFLDVLERQFRFNDRTMIELRHPSQFAELLGVHVNHLNRALKETFSQTTTNIISIRILYEAKRLLAESDRNIADIAYFLRFSEAPHFNNFFKKRTQISPRKFRQLIFHGIGKEFIGC